VKFKSFFYFALLPLFSLQAQNLSIAGHVTDTAKQFIPYAPVKLLRDTVLLQYTLSDTTGYFEFEHLAQGNYTLWITTPGYKDLKKEIRLTRSLKDINIRLIPAAENLDAVEITVKPPVEITQNAVRLNVEGTVLENKRDLNQILRYAPNVTLIDGLKILGSDRIILRIDGRKITGTSQIMSYLMRLTPENIRYIEIRDNGDAEMGGEQAAEIVIRTKKVLGMSFIPYANFRYNSAPGFNGGADWYYTKGKFRYWLNAYGEYSKVFSYQHNQTGFTQQIFYDEEGHTRLKRLDYGFSFGTDYYKNDQTTAGFFYDYFYDADKDFQKESLKRIETPQTTDSLVQTSGYYNHEINEHLVHLYYEKYTDTLNSYWRFSTEYVRSHFSNPGETAHSFYSGGSLSDGEIHPLYPLYQPLRHLWRRMDKRKKYGRRHYLENRP